MVGVLREKNMVQRPSVYRLRITQGRATDSAGQGFRYVGRNFEGRVCHVGKSFYRRMSIKSGISVYWLLLQIALGWNHPMLVVKRIIAAVFGLVPLVLIAAGVAMVFRELRPTDPLLYSVQQDGGTPRGLHLCGCGCARIIRLPPSVASRCRLEWTLMPIAVMVAAIAIPNLLYGHHGSPSDRAYSQYVPAAGRSPFPQSSWLRNKASLPVIHPETIRAISFHPTVSPLPYVINVCSIRLGRRWPIPGTAGDVSFHRRPDRKQAWFAATVLARRTDRHATWLTPTRPAAGHRIQCAGEN